MRFFPGENGSIFLSVGAFLGEDENVSGSFLGKYGIISWLGSSLSSKNETISSSVGSFLGEGVSRSLSSRYGIIS